MDAGLARSDRRSLVQRLFSVYIAAIVFLYDCALVAFKYDGIVDFQSLSAHAECIIDGESYSAVQPLAQREVVIVAGLEPKEALIDVWRPEVARICACL